MVNVFMVLTASLILGGLCGWGLCLSQQTKAIDEIRKKYEADHIAFMKALDKVMVSLKGETQQKGANSTDQQTPLVKMDLGNLKRFAQELKNILVRQENQNTQAQLLVARIVQEASQAYSEWPGEPEGEL